MKMLQETPRKKKGGPWKSHSPKLAFIAMKMTQKRLEKRGWTFKILLSKTGIYCYKNDSRNASRKEVEPSKSHSSKLAYIAMKMTQKTPREKRLDLQNLTLQNWHILL